MAGPIQSRNIADILELSQIYANTILLVKIKTAKSIPNRVNLPQFLFFPSYIWKRKRLICDRFTRLRGKLKLISSRGYKHRRQSQSTHENLFPEFPTLIDVFFLFCQQFPNAGRRHMRQLSAQEVPRNEPHRNGQGQKKDRSDPEGLVLERVPGKLVH